MNRVLLAAALFASSAAAQHQQIIQLVDQHAAHFSATSRTIWEYAEVGYKEQKSSALLQKELKAAGFVIQSPVADEPTAFTATFGQGKPVIGIMGEFDALPGLSQAALPDRSPVVRRARRATHAAIIFWAQARRWQRLR